MQGSHNEIQIPEDVFLTALFMFIFQCCGKSQKL